MNLYSFSQESNINNRFNIQIGYSQREFIHAIQYETVIDSGKNWYAVTIDSVGFNKTKAPIKNISLNYGYSNHFEMGISLIFTTHNDFGIPVFNIQQKIHFFPYSKISKKLDIYIPYSAGINFNSYTKKIYLSCFDIALGGAFNISHNFGCFAELHIQSLESYLYLSNPYLQFGLSYTLHTKQKSHE